MRKLILIAVLVLFAASTAWTAGLREVREWPDPDQMITVVVPFAAGGGTDLIFRALVDEMNRFTDSTVIVDNIGGAGSATGTNEVLTMPADGYTVLASGAHTVTATLQGLTDGYTKLEGIIGLNWDPFVVAVHKSKPWTSFEEVVQVAKADPGSISFGNAGMGGATGVLTVGMNLYFDNIFNVTPFDGGADLLANVFGGFADMGVFSQSEVVNYIHELRPIMIVYPERSRLELLSDVPTFIEEGFHDLNVPYGSYRSLSVREGTPAHIKVKLAEIAENAFNSERFQQFMLNNGLLPAYSELDELDAYFVELENMYKPVLDAAGLR